MGQSPERFTEKVAEKKRRAARGVQDLHLADGVRECATNECNQSS
jgi:hypothetical protein